MCGNITEQLNAKRMYAEQIEENITPKVSLLAFISKDAITKENLTIEDVASPFPLLDPGNEYVLFLLVAHTGVSVYHDFVWGLYAYLVKDGKVYSMNYIEYPVKLDPVEFFEDESINWKWGSYTYCELRQIAIQKLKACAVQLEDFIENVLC